MYPQCFDGDSNNWDLANTLSEAAKSTHDTLHLPHGVPSRSGVSALTTFSSNQQEED
jgi:hypothetical protein